MNTYLRILLDFSDFKGRASRRDYWVFTGIQLLIVAPLLALDIALDTFNTDLKMGAFTGVFFGLTVLPSWAVTVRRLHDTNRSGWWQLVTLIPWVGPLLVLMFCLDRSTNHSNAYGPCPTTGA